MRSRFAARTPGAVGIFVGERASPARGPGSRSVCIESPIPPLYQQQQKDGFSEQQCCVLERENLTFLLPDLGRHSEKIVLSSSRNERAGEKHKGDQVLFFLSEW